MRAEESVAEVSRQDLGLVLWKLGPRRLLDISVCRKQQLPGSEDSFKDADGNIFTWEEIEAALLEPSKSNVKIVNHAISKV